MSDTPPPHPPVIARKPTPVEPQPQSQERPPRYYAKGKTAKRALQAEPAAGEPGVGPPE